MVRRSVPASSRWVAKLWRMVWAVMFLPRPAALAGTLADLLYARGGNGPAGDRAGKEDVGWPSSLPVGAEDLQQPRREHDVTILPALALRTWITMRWLSMSVTCSWVTSETRKPAA